MRCFVVCKLVLLIFLPSLVLVHCEHPDSNCFYYDVESASGIRSFEDCSDNSASEYIIEELPVRFMTTYPKDDWLYFINTEKELYKMDDHLEAVFISETPIVSNARMLFVSSNNDFFLSSWGDNERVWKYDPALEAWKGVLEIDSWRMTEDNRGALYIGDYEKEKSKPARIFKSEDNGESWEQIFTDEDNHHVHTLRFDETTDTLWTAIGDGDSRGQYYSLDYGRTFESFVVGHKQGHTDVAFSNDYIFWASDDGSGEVFRHKKNLYDVYEYDFQCEQYIWFIVAKENQIYVGTMPKRKGQKGTLLASSDQGNTWERVFETQKDSNRAYNNGLISNPRELTASGWLYFSADNKYYRVRHL